MNRTFVELIQVASSSIIDVRVTVRTESGTWGLRSYSFDNDVPFNEIMTRIGVVLDSTVKIVLRAPFGSVLRRTALRSVETGGCVLDSDSPAREALSIDAAVMETERERLERCFAKDVFGQ